MRVLLPTFVRGSASTKGSTPCHWTAKSPSSPGPGRGLGLAYAQELARQGASVVVNDVDAEAAADAVASDRGAGGRAVAVVAPVGPTETAKELVSTAVEHFGRLDILVTNAGVLRDTVLWKMSDDDFDTVINVHLRGTFTCVREAVQLHAARPAMAGRIICIGSPTGQRGNFGQTNYAAAKAGIVGMVRTWALELKRAGITANAVIPVAATAMTATVPYFAAAVEAEANGEPMPAFFRHDLGFGTADDVAGLVAFLASDAAAGVTGQAIGVGGDRLQIWTHPEAGADRVPRGRLDVRGARGGLADDVRRRRCRPSARRSRRCPRSSQPATPDRPEQAQPDGGWPAVRTRDRPRRAHGDRHARAHRGRRPRPRLAARRPRRGGGRRTSRRTARGPTSTRSRAYYRERQHGGRRLHRRRARPSWSTQPLSSADIAARRPHATTTCSSRSARSTRAPAERPSTAPHRLIEEQGVRGFKFHPTVQGFDPSDDEYSRCGAHLQEPGVPALFHTGQTGIGAGLPGGYGLRLGLSNPMLLDAVAADFPDLQIIMAHPSVPWQDEALSVATHKHNTWIDLSGWSPKYFPAELVRYANSVLKDRVLFGTDFPLLTPDRWLRDVQTTGLKPEVLPGHPEGQRRPAAGPLTRSTTRGNP